MKVSCLGPDGSYSCLAARELSPDAEIVLCPTFLQAIASLGKGESDAVVLPIENSIQGGVLQNLDLLQRTEDLYAVKEYVLKIEHRLAYLNGSSLDKIRTVYSHPQALGQCSDFLNDYLPNAKQEAVDSTAESLEKIVDETCAGIVGSHVKREGIVLSEKSISNEASNFTHFLLLKRGKENIAEHTKRVFFHANCRHRPGALLKLLQVIYVYDLNMTKIESRPIRTSPGEYSFFIEFEGDYSDWKVKKAIEDIRSECSSLKILGAY